MTTLYVNGCSWTVGTELEYDHELFDSWRRTQPDNYDIVDYYNLYNWSAYLGKKLDAKVINQAIGGGSNHRMIRQTIDFINTLDGEQRNDLVVVLGWTSAERGEIFIEDSRLHGWHRFNMTQMFSDFLYQHEKDAAKDLVNSIEKYQEHHIASGLSWVGSIEVYLQQQFMMKNTLENLGIKYLFFQSVPAWWDVWIQPKGIDVYKLFPQQLKNTEHANNIGVYFNDAMQTVCNVKGFKHAPAMHVLSEGHKYWAEEVLFPRIMELYGQEEHSDLW
jgi:hypothetical protein